MDLNDKAAIPIILVHFEATAKENLPTKEEEKRSLLEALICITHDTNLCGLITIIILV